MTADGRYESGSPGALIGARLGDLRDSPDLLSMDRKTFVRRLSEAAPEKPPNYERVIAVNAGRESVEDEREATKLELGPNDCAA